MAYPGVNPSHSVVSSGSVAVGVGGVIVGALVGAGVVASRKLVGPVQGREEGVGTP